LQQPGVKPTDRMMAFSLGVAGGGSISASETVSMTPPANPSENAIIRSVGLRQPTTIIPPSPVESPARLVIKIAVSMANSFPFILFFS